MNTAPAPLIRTPLGQRLVLEATGFVYNGKRHAYSEVRHLEFKQEVRRLNQGIEPARRSYESLLRLNFVGGKWLVIKLITPLRAVQRTADKSVHDVVGQVAEVLAAKTFDARMDGHMAGFTAKKYLSWGHYQLSANGDLFKRFAFCMNLRDSRVNTLLFPYYFTSVRKPKRWWRLMIWTFIHGGERLDLLRDRDCFLYFMRLHLGFYWPAEKLRLWHGKAADGSTDKPKESVRPDGGKQAPPPPPPPTPKPMAGSVQHLAMLGLTGDVPWEAVRGAYRRLARENHPDLMRGRGASAEALKTAEERLKVINQAYGWLEDFYRLKPKR